jgi:hypothetical protein
MAHFMARLGLFPTRSHRPEPCHQFGTRRSSLAVSERDVPPRRRNQRKPHFVPALCLLKAQKFNDSELWTNKAIRAACGATRNSAPTRLCFAATCAMLAPRARGARMGHRYQGPRALRRS